MTYEELYTEAAICKLGEVGIPVPAKDEMTCNRCVDADTCSLAWDLYNTNGDCLADK
jgi:hypothetical protein